MSESKPKQVILTGNSVNHRNTPTTFLNQVIELAAQGYVLHPKPATLRQFPRFMGKPSCIMVTKEYAKEILDSVKEEVVVQAPEPEIVPEDTPEPKVEDKVEPEIVPEQTTNEDSNNEPSIEEVVKAIEGKADLLAFAKEKGLTVPDNKKVPKAIQKWLIQELTK